MRIIPPTPGTRWMLWVYPAITIAYGLMYLYQSPARLQSGAFEQAKNVMPMHAWGLVFLIVGITKALGIIQGSDWAYLSAMSIGSGLFAGWGCLFLASAFTSSTASFTGCLLPFGWSVAHIAMLSTMSRNLRLTHPKAAR